MNKSISAADTSIRYYPLWKVFLTIFGIVILITTVGQLVGHRYFWSGYDMRRIEREIRHYQKLVDAEPANPGYRVDLGFAYFRRGHLDLAIRQYEDALRTDKNFMPAHLSLGYAYYQLGMLNEALASFVQVTELAPEDYRGFLNVGICYYELKMFEEAKKNLYRARMLNPAAAEVLYHLGTAYEHEGIPNAAIELYQEALTKNPKMTEARQALSRLGQQ